MLKKFISITAILALLPACNINIDAKYNHYPQIGVEAIGSTNYELVKVAELGGYKQKGDVHFMKQSKTFVVNTSLISYARFDSQGNFLSEYSQYPDVASFHSSGVFFYKYYFVDWLLTGDNTKKKYAKRIQGDSLSKAQFEQYLNRAEVSVYKTLWQDEPEKSQARCFLKIEGEWLLIESDLPDTDDWRISRTTLGQEKIMHGYALKEVAEFTLLRNRIIPWYDWKDTKNPIYIETHQRRTKHKKSFMDINNHSRGTGWDSTAYFHLKAGDEGINFKAAAYETAKSPRSFNANMGLYRHTKAPDVALLIVGQGRGDRQPIETGVYALRNRSLK